MNPNEQQPSNTPPTPPVAPQPPASDAYGQPAPQAAAPYQQNDPGQGLAIAGVVSAFFMPLVGLILSIVAKNRSKAVGIHNSLAKAGVILNSVLLALQVIIAVGILIAIIMSATAGIQGRANTQASVNNASAIAGKAHAYEAVKGSHPTSLADFESIEGADSDSASLELYKAYISDSPITAADTPGKVAIYTCGQEGIAIEYWDGQKESTAVRYTGSASALSTCTQMQ